MDQQRRLLSFSLVSFVLLFAWINVGPKWFPGFFPPPQPKPVVKKDDQKAKEAPAGIAAVEPGEVKDTKDAKTEVAVAENLVKLPEHPTQNVVIGSDDPKTGFGLRVSLSSVGAGIISAELNEERYRALKGPKPGMPAPHLSLLGNNLKGALKPLVTTPPVTGHLAIAEIDEKLKKLDPLASLARLDWKVLPTESDSEGDAKGLPKAVTFEIKTPDGLWEIKKRYEVRRWLDAKTSRDTDPTGYQVAVQLTLRNLSSKGQTVAYVLQGPVGIPLENAEHTSKFRDVKFGIREPDGDLGVTNAMTIHDIVKASDKNQIEEFKPGNGTFQYVGLDTQYFTTLVMPQDAAKKHASYLDSAKPQVVEKNVALPAHSEIGLQLYSVEQEIPPESEIVHDFNLYLGPKRVSLLASLGADKVIDYSGFLFIPAALVAGIGSLLLWLLNSFHSIGLPYGICVMLLTVLVRSCMFPISKKQAANAKKMKELQPKIAELKTKYGDDKQKIAQAQMELFAQHNFNPLGGCLPVLLQLPIFIGLYQSLSSSIDLRLAPFLWASNLAAPDSLFMLPFELPFLGNEFNLLPILTTTLFLVQQKMFMPPPTDEQTRMQAKMFFWMTLMMGFMFYHVPAGLCVYFIASSVWSMGERKLLDYGTGNAPPPSNLVIEVQATSPTSTPASKPNGGFWGRIAARLEEMGELKDVNGIPVNAPRRDQKGKKKNR